MSAHCSDPSCSTCQGARVRKVEIRDGRRYIDGRDVGPAQPEANPHRNYQRRGGRR